MSAARRYADFHTGAPPAPVTPAHSIAAPAASLRFRRDSLARRGPDVAGKGVARVCVGAGRDRLKASAAYVPEAARGGACDGLHQRRGRPGQEQTHYPPGRVGRHHRGQGRFFLFTHTSRASPRQLLTPAGPHICCPLIRAPGSGQEDNDPRDKDTLIKTLIDLKAACMEAEKTNRKMRDQLEKGNLVLIERGMRDQQERAQPDAQAWLFGKFAFKDKKAHTPYLAGVKSATQWAGAAPVSGGQGKSPALMKLLSTDHLQFREFSRSMLLHDVQLLTRYEQKLEAETKQVKLDSVRLERQLQQLHSRVTAVSRPLSAPSARSNSAAPTSGTTRQGAGTTRQGAGSDKASLSEIARVEQECHVALELASVLKSIQRDNEAERSKRAAPPAAPFPRSPSAPGGKASGSSSLEPPQSAGGVGAGAGDGPAGGTAQHLEPPLELPAASVADFAYPAHGSGATPRLIYNVVIRTGSCRLVVQDHLCLNAGTLEHLHLEHLHAQHMQHLVSLASSLPCIGCRA